MARVRDSSARRANDATGVPRRGHASQAGAAAHGPRGSVMAHARVCVLRVDGTWHADGARVADAQQTRRGHARS
eukprot:5777566-Prymnesium_polylepis.1